MRRFEMKEGTSSKFWEVRVEQKTVFVRFGRIGTEGQTKLKEHASPAVALAEADKLIAEKVKKGYREVAGGAVPPPVAAAPAADSTAAVPERILELRELAAAARDGQEPLVRTHVLLSEGKLAKGAARGVTRAGGGPIGVTEATRPKFDGAYMHHLITLDLDDVPTLRAHAALQDAKALALFISNASDNEAFDEDTEETKVVILGEADVALGEWSGPAVKDPKPRGLSAWPVDVPASVFTYDPYATDELDESAPLYELYSALMSSCRAGGGVIHWSGDEATEGFLFQFNEDLVDVNLGDAGTMYVFLDRAYWAGH